MMDICQIIRKEGSLSCSPVPCSLCGWPPSFALRSKKPSTLAPRWGDPGWRPAAWKMGRGTGVQTCQTGSLTGMKTKQIRYRPGPMFYIFVFMIFKIILVSGGRKGTRSNHLANSVCLSVCLSVCIFSRFGDVLNHLHCRRTRK